MNKKRWINKGNKLNIKNKIDIKNRINIKNTVCVMLLSILFCGASVFNVITNYFSYGAGIVVYVFSAVAFVVFCIYFTNVIILLKNKKVIPYIHKNNMLNTIVLNRRLRVVLTATMGMLLNMMFAVFNGVIGVSAKSAWYVSLSVYYLILCLMRLMSVDYAGKLYLSSGRQIKGITFLFERLIKQPKGDLKVRELKIYGYCGFMFTVMSVALFGAVIILTHGKGGKTYPGLMIYTVAVYTFYKMIISVVNMIKAKKEKSYLLTTLRNISYADALVSMLSLQTALLNEFGNKNDTSFSIIGMNTITGVSVCLMIFVLGMYMIFHARKLKQKYT